jgi:hypothetical protein
MAPTSEAAWTYVEEVLSHSTPSEPVVVESIPESMVVDAQQIAGVWLEPMESSSEYLYDADTLIELPGKALRGKRNRINKFNRENPGAHLVRLADASPEQIEAARELARRWLAEMEFDSPADRRLAEAEIDAVNQHLDHWKELELYGGILLVGPQAVAFTLGEYVPESQMVVVHTEKADRNYAGAYQVINQAFLKDLRAQGLSFRYVNRQEGSGIDGLDQSKQSYQPIGQIRSFRAWVDNPFPPATP